MKTLSWLACVALASLVSASTAVAASHTWGGATSGIWSDATNWSAGGAPGAGETGVVLLFPTAQGHMTGMTNDVANLGVTSITFSDTAYSVTGNAINLAGTITVDAGGILFNGVQFGLPIVLTADSMFVSTDGRFLSLTAQISGPFGITTQQGPGSSHSSEVRVGGANTYTGVTTVASGYLIMENAQALGAGDGTPATGTVVVSGATLSVTGTVANEALTIGGLGYGSNGALQNSGASEWAGPITLTSETALNILTGPFTLSGPIAEATPGLAMRYVASAPVILAGTNDYSGTDRIESGTVYFDGANLFAGVQTNLVGIGGGAARGTGMVHGITAGGASASGNAVAPGTDVATGILTTTSLTMDVNSTLQIRINGPTAGTDYDQIASSGPTTLNGAALAVTIGGGYTAPVGTVFTILSNTETINSVTGTFAGLPNTAVVTIGGQNFRIDYGVGLTGSDITLTRIAGTPVELTHFAAE